MKKYSQTLEAIPMSKNGLKRLLKYCGDVIMTVDIFRQWTLKKIEQDPKLYGGDKGNPTIIHIYLAELYAGSKVEDLTHAAISQSVAVSRMQNKFLVVYPAYDFREKYKPKKKRDSHQDHDIA